MLHLCRIEQNVPVPGCQPRTEGAPTSLILNAVLLLSQSLVMSDFSSTPQSSASTEISRVFDPKSCQTTETGSGRPSLPDGGWAE